MKSFDFHTGKSNRWIPQFEKTQCTELLKFLQPCEIIALPLIPH